MSARLCLTNPSNKMEIKGRSGPNRRQRKREKGNESMKGSEVMEMKEMVARSKACVRARGGRENRIFSHNWVDCASL